MIMFCGYRQDFLHSCDCIFDSQFCYFLRSVTFVLMQFHITSTSLFHDPWVNKSSSSTYACTVASQKSIVAALILKHYSRGAVITVVTTRWPDRHTRCGNERSAQEGLACTMAIVYACTMIIVHACNMIIVHACTMIIVYACMY